MSDEAISMASIIVAMLFASGLAALGCWSWEAGHHALALAFFAPVGRYVFCKT